MTANKAHPTGRLQEIRADYELKGGWIKMPMEEILFNPRLTGQARQLWGWLAAAKSMSENSVCLPSWQACELKMNCGTSSRRRSLIQLVDEGFVSLSADGKVVTMHDPVKVYKKQRQAMADEICKECSELRGEVTETQLAVIETPEPKVSKETVDERQVIIDAWNTCKPESYSKIRVLSAKQRECINKHLKNLGLNKSDINEFICSVCRGLDRSDFWSKQVDVKTRNFNAVFGYGNPNDTKMKNIENLYLDGDPDQVPAAENRPQKYNELQQEKIDLLKALEYQISMNNPQDDYVQRFFDQRDVLREELTELGVDWSNL
jgi:hypothetical protein